MDYHTFEPNEELQPFVKCYWVLESKEGQKKQEKQTIVPDGCMEMVFHYRDLYKQYTEDGNTIVQPRSFVMGQLTRPLEIEPILRTGIFSVRFQPNGFFPFASFCIKEMENTAVPLENIFGKGGEKIEMDILAAETSFDRIKIIERFLLEQLSNGKMIDRIIKSTVDTIFEFDGKLSVNELSQIMQVSRRQLERKFSFVIGLSPKQLLKTMRLQRTLKILLNKDFVNLTSLAYENEYYDQAHFIKDFKELTGSNPKDFYGNNLIMSSLFYGGT